MLIRITIKSLNTYTVVYCTVLYFAQSYNRVYVVLAVMETGNACAAHMLESQTFHS